MTRPSLDDLIAATGEVATLPATVIRLLDLLEDSTTCADQVRDVLERDPAMTANVLKLANSAYYGARRTISSVRDALVMLGNRAVVTLAFATGMAPVLRRDLDAYDLTRDDFWRHSIMAAAAASLAADLTDQSHWRTQSFTAGLVHDVGKLVIDNHLVNCHETLPGGGHGEDLRRRERDLLGFDHAEAGAALALAWGFPEMLVAAVGHHHDLRTETEHLPVVTAVAVGDIVAGALAADPDHPWSPGVRTELQALGCEADEFEQLRLDLADNLDETLTAAATPSPCLV